MNLHLTDTLPVRQERTGWRDQQISSRHRDWGFNCPCVDLDFLVVEYNYGKPVALVEYKHFLGKPVVKDHATYRSLRLLADMHGEGALPFFVSRYWPDMWAFQVIPLNETAKKWFAENEVMTERDYVSRLYRMRQRTLAENLIPILHNELPTEIAA